MIEMHILKVGHSGVRKASELAPYIQRCDIYAPENAAMSEEYAAKFEAIWEKAISNDVGAAESYNKLAKSMGAWCSSNPSKISGDWLLTEFGILYDAKKPLWFLERWDTESSKRLNDHFDQTLTHFREANQRFRAGDIEQALKFMPSFWQTFNESNIMRDKHIAQQIEKCERRIRSRYPSLATREPLCFTACLGGMHNPELYTSLPVSVHSVTEKDSLFSVQKRIIAAKSYDDARRDIIISLAVNDSPNLDEEMLRDLDERELVQHLRKEGLIGR